MLEKSKIFAVRRRIENPNKTLMALLLGVILSLICFTTTATDRGLPGLGHTLNKLSKPIDAPGFSLKDMDENRHSLHDYRGKVILLNFWATWCPPCRREMPSMERLYQKFKDEAFVVLAINQWEDPDHVFAYTGQLNTDPTFPILFDRESEVSAAYGVKGLPTTYLLDKEGAIRYRAIGGREFDHPEVEGIIRRLLQ